MKISLETTPPAGWVERLTDLEGATFCHLPQWAEIMTGTLGHEFAMLVARDDEGTLVGGLPLVRMRSFPFGHTLVSMPFLNYGGPTGPGAVRSALVREAVEFAGRSGADRLVLRGQLDTEASLSPGRDKVMVRLSLGEDPEDLWKRLPSKLRSQVRRPRKEGMVARIGPEERDAFYRVFAENMRDLGTPVHSRRLFQALSEAFPEEVLFGAVYHGDVPVAGGCGFLWNGEYEMTWASSLRRFSRQAPNMLLYWSFMEEVLARGATTFNFGRSTPDTGTHRFKRQWGGEDEPLHWLEWDRSGMSEEHADSGEGLAWASRIWQRLPLPLANRVGPILSRRIPTF